MMATDASWPVELNPANVLGSIAEAFQHHVQHGAPDAFDPTGWLSASLTRIADQVPYLDAYPRACPPKEGSLVRMVGMLQNTFDPEYYVDVYQAPDDGGELKLWCSRYRETLPPQHAGISPGGPTSVLRSRQPIFCVPIPGQAEWARQTRVRTAPSPATQTSVASSSSASKKRSLEDDDEQDVAMDQHTSSDAAAASLAQPGNVQTTQRRRVESEQQQQQQQQQQQGSTTNNTTQNAPAAVQDQLNIPLASEHGVPVIAKIYADGDDDLKLHDVLDMIGVYMYEPTPVEPPTEPSFVERPPSSLVPRLHVLAYNKLGHCNPLLPTVISEDVVKAGISEAAQARELLKNMLRTALRGDELAAEYALLGLLSAVHTRMDGRAMGPVSVNIAGVSEDHIDVLSRLRDLVSAISPASHTLPMDVNTLNSIRLTPKKNNQVDRLDAGLLQLCPGTHLILDETSMQPGQLQEQGVKNLMALQKLLTEQNVHAEFEHFGAIPFKSDVNVLVVSEGKSMLPANCLVPLQAQGPPSDLPAVSEDQLNAVRRYMSIIRHLPFTINDEAQKAIEQDFVEMRKASPSNVTGETLHGLLNLSRWYSLSHGCTELTTEAWSRMRVLEAARETRVSQLPRRKAPES